MPRKLKPSMIDAAMSRDDKCVYEISTAEKDIERISGMSDEDLSSEAQSHYDKALLFYKTRLTSLHINGDETYDGEQIEMLKEFDELKLLSPSEWKDTILTNSQNRKDHFQEDLDNINVLKDNNVAIIGAHPAYK